MPGSEVYGAARAGKAHPNDLGITPDPQGELYIVSADLIIHVPDWTTSPAPRRLPRMTRCGLDVQDAWRVAAGVPRRAICEDCRREATSNGQ